MATKKTTEQFLKGLTGNQSLAQKVTPTFMRFSKSLPARYSLAAAVLGSGAIVVYKYLPGGEANATTKSPNGSRAFVFVGEIDSNGNLREETAGKKP